MAHVIEAAASGRAKCRGCNRTIARGDLRLGERFPNPFGEGEMTLWFHLSCAAYKRPEPFLAAADATDEMFDGREALLEHARTGLTHPRLPRIDGVERAPSGRARCRDCKALIEKTGWRIPLVYYQEGRFEPSGFIHLGCAESYLGTTDILDRLTCFSTDLDPSDVEELGRVLGSN